MSDVGYQLPPHQAARATQWRPGQSGNPSGKHPSLSEGLRRLIYEQEPERYQAICRALADLAVQPGKPQIPALQMVLDRLDGKLVERHLNVNVSTTPELLESARAQLMGDRQEEQQLLADSSQIAALPVLAQSNVPAPVSHPGTNPDTESLT